MNEKRFGLQCLMQDREIRPCQGAATSTRRRQREQQRHLGRSLVRAAPALPNGQHQVCLQGRAPEKQVCPWPLWEVVSLQRSGGADRERPYNEQPKQAFSQRHSTCGTLWSRFFLRRRSMWCYNGVVPIYDDGASPKPVVVAAATLHQHSAAHGSEPAVQKLPVDWNAIFDCCIFQFHVSFCFCLFDVSVSGLDVGPVPEHTHFVGTGMQLDAQDGHEQVIDAVPGQGVVRTKA